jgi:hypothetical protein
MSYQPRTGKKRQFTTREKIIHYGAIGFTILLAVTVLAVGAYKLWLEPKTVEVKQGMSVVLNFSDGTSENGIVTFLSYTPNSNPLKTDLQMTVRTERTSYTFLREIIGYGNEEDAYFNKDYIRPMTMYQDASGIHKLYFNVSRNGLLLAKQDSISEQERKDHVLAAIS